MEPTSHLSAWMPSASRYAELLTFPFRKIELRQREEMYLAPRMCAVSFFCLNLLLFNELNIRGLNKRHGSCVRLPGGGLRPSQRMGTTQPPGKHAGYWRRAGIAEDVDRQQAKNHSWLTLRPPSRQET